MYNTVLNLHMIRTKTTTINRTEMITKIQTLRKDFLKYQMKKKYKKNLIQKNITLDTLSHRENGIKTNICFVFEND